MNPNNLYEYYQSQGQRLPSVAERREVAQQAGIQNYTGSSQQNQQLLGFLTQQQSTAPINLGQIDLDTSPINLPATQQPPEVNIPTSTFVPTEFNREGLSQERDTLQREIADIEKRMQNRAIQQEDAYNEAGLFDDLRRLSTLRGELTRTQNEEIAIPIRATQELRGRGATSTEFEQTTRPRLEDNLLEQLGYNTQVSSLSTAIQTESAIIDQRINAERERDNFMYTQKMNRLNQVENAYANILSNEQKSQLELAKKMIELQQDEDKVFLDEKKKWADFFRSNGDIESAMQVSQSNDLMQINDIVKRNSGITKDEKARDTIFRATELDATFNKISDAIDTTGAGFQTAVGPNMFARIGTANITGRTAEFVADTQSLIAKLVQNKMLDMIAQGMGVKSVDSDAELRALRDSVTSITGAVIEEGGQIKGYKMTESKFKQEFQNLQKIHQINTMMNVANLTSDQVLSLVYRDANEINNLYEAFNQSRVMIENTRNIQNSPFSQTFSTVGNDTNNQIVSFIKEQEGFSPTAYRDGAGWSIGYGNQTHPDGRPVRQGDRIDQSQADVYLADSIKKHSNWRNLVTRQLSPSQQAALASFEYNLGPNIWNSGQSAQGIINAVNQGNFTLAAQLMQQFNKSQGRTLAVLERRRALEGQLLTNFG